MPEKQRENSYASLSLEELERKRKELTNFLYPLQSEIESLREREKAFQLELNKVERVFARRKIEKGRIKAVKCKALKILEPTHTPDYLGKCLISSNFSARWLIENLFFYLCSDCKLTPKEIELKLLVHELKKNTK